MLREELTHSEQIIADYGWVSGHRSGYVDGWNDSQKLACRDKKTCSLLGIALGIIVGELIEDAVDYFVDHDVAEKARNWANEQKEKVKSKFSRKKNKKF